MTLARSFLVLALAALAACGGGGGGSSSTPPGPGTTATPGPAVTAGSVTTLSLVSGSLVASENGGASGAVTTLQVPTTPTQPPTGGALATFPATVSVTGSGARSSARAIAAARLAEDRSAQTADRLREVPPAAFDLAHLLPATRSAQHLARSAEAARRTRYAVGDTRTFFIVTQNIGNSGGCANGGVAGTFICNVSITTKLMAAGAHGRVWVDTASLANANEFTRPGEFATVATDFDAYYAYETANYAPAFYPGVTPLAYAYSANKGQCDANGNALPSAQWQPTDVSGSDGGFVDVVVTDALSGTGEGGYYYAANEFPQQFWNCAPAPRPPSNGTPMFVIGGNNYTTGPNLPQYNEDYWINTDIPRTLSHELQHLIHFHYKVLGADLRGAPETLDNAFIDEGISMLSEDIAVGGSPIDTPRYSYSYLLEPSLFSLTAFTGYQPNPSSTASPAPYGWYSNTAGSYGQAYLMTRYLYDRFGGASAIKAIYASTASGVGPQVAAAGGEAFPQLFSDFNLAVAAQGTNAASGRYGFSPGVVLRGTVTLPSRRSVPLNVRTLVFGGPQPPETFSAGLPSSTAPLGAGGTLSTFVVDGGALFVPTASGSLTVTVAAPGATIAQGGIVQGLVPTPQPTSL